MNCRTGKLFSIKRILSLSILSLSLISCQTITVRPDGKPVKLSTPPDYQKSHNFFLGGLVGEAVVPAGEICKERSVAQLQSQTTFTDGLWPSLMFLAAFVGGMVWLYNSIGPVGPNFDFNAIDLKDFPGPAFLISISPLLALIYNPKTAKVWCGEKPDISVNSGISEEAG